MTEPDAGERRPNTTTRIGGERLRHLFRHPSPETPHQTRSTSRGLIRDVIDHTTIPVAVALLLTVGIAANSSYIKNAFSSSTNTEPAPVLVVPTPPILPIPDDPNAKEPPQWSTVPWVKTGSASTGGNTHTDANLLRSLTPDEDAANGIINSVDGAVVVDR